MIVNKIWNFISGVLSVGLVREGNLEGFYGVEEVVNKRKNCIKK
jgi:hypothetical protein